MPSTSVAMQAVSAVNQPVGGDRRSNLRTSVLQKHAALGHDDGYVSINMAFAMFSG